MNANEMADLMILFDSGRIYEHSVEIADMLRQQQEQINNLKQWEKRQLDVIETQQAEIEALKMGFANSGTHDSELAETRAMAGRLFLKVQDLEFERKGYENLTEMLESEKAELTEKNCQQQAEIEELKTCLIVEQEHNERIEAILRKAQEK